MSERLTPIRRERPERIVHLDLRDRQIVRAIVEDGGDDGARLERDALKRQSFDRRNGSATNRVGGTRPEDDGEQPGEQHEGYESEDETRRPTAFTGCPMHDGFSCHASPPGRAPSTRAPRTHSDGRGT